MAKNTEENLLPEKIGRYVVECELGQGGMGAVYLAHDPYMNRRVAIKMIAPSLASDPLLLARFQTEAQIIAQLEHAYIVPVYDFGEQEGCPYLVMRYMPNYSLAYWLREGALPISDCVMILERMAEALDEAHSRSLVHRDFKPANILFDRQGGAYLADFGLAKIVAGDLESSHDFIAGTAAYMAPEQVMAEREVDGRADIYAMGVTLFEMLTGRAPYHHPTPTKLMMMHALQPVPSILEVAPDLPSGVEAIIQKAMAKEPDARYPLASNLVDALASVGRTILTRRARRRWMADELRQALDAIADEDQSPSDQAEQLSK